MSQEEVVQDESRFEQVLFDSEDSYTINTSFIERYNLTVHQGSGYLCKRTSCHCRQDNYLEEHQKCMPGWCLRSYRTQMCYLAG